jgi:hypothetical protein
LVSKELIELRQAIVRRPLLCGARRRPSRSYLCLWASRSNRASYRASRDDGANITGFIPQETAMAGKWLELLTRIAPGVKRVAAMFNPDTLPAGSYYVSAFEAAAKLLKVASVAAPVHSDAEIETVITSLGGEPGTGLVVLGDSFMLCSSRACLIAGGPKQRTGDLLQRRVCQGWRFAFLWTRLHRHISSRCSVCRSHSPRHKAGRPSGSGASQI